MKFRYREPEAGNASVLKDNRGVCSRFNILFILRTKLLDMPISCDIRDMGAKRKKVKISCSIKESALAGVEYIDLFNVKFNCFFLEHDGLFENT